MRKVITLVALALAIALGGVGYASAATPTEQISRPIGNYPDGSFLVCVTTASPYYVRGHAGAKTKSCPAGTRLMQLNEKGDDGPIGPQGPKGDPGKDAEAPEPVYGVATVNVQRGAGQPTSWAKMSTPIGGPVGSATSNTFRFTCRAVQAPCFVSAGAYGTEPGVQVYPRLLITKENIDTGKPEGTCEYADGANNAGEKMPLLQNVEKTLTLGIGSSLDCGSDQINPESGTVPEIKVPAGYYNVSATFVFTK